MTDVQTAEMPHLLGLATLGIGWQLITLAGFRCDALSIDLFAKGFSRRGAAAYLQTTQRKEHEYKVHGDLGGVRVWGFWSMGLGIWGQIRVCFGFPQKGLGHEMMSESE